MSVIHEKITIEDALNFESANFLFFKQIFLRVCELCSRDIDDTANLKKNYEERLKKELVRGRTRTIIGIIQDIKDEPRLDKRKAQMIYFHAIYALDNAFAYCLSVNARETNSLNKLIFDKSNSASSEAESLSIMLNSLNTLEDITSNHLTGEVTRHFVEKAIEKTTKQERKHQSKGGKIRAEKYEKQKSIIFEAWEKGSFHSYAACAKHFANQLNLSNKTIENWLSNKYSQAKKKI